MWDRHLVSSDAMLYAYIAGALLTTYRSVVVDTSGRLYGPVAGFLAGNCTELLSAEELQDPAMVFGAAYSVVRKVHVTCPGADHPHRCHTSADIDKEVESFVGRQKEWISS